jgi:hypothetical protein
LYYLIAAGLARLTGGSINACYYSGRLLTMLSLVACLVLVARLARQSGANGTWSIGAALAAMTNPGLRMWAGTCRPDLLAIMLALSGFACVQLTPTCRRVAIAGTLFVAAIFTKQTMIAAPIAAGIVLVVQKKWKPAATLAICTIAGGVIGTLLLDYWTGGMFSVNVFRANVAPLSWDQPIEFVREFYVNAARIPLFFGLLGLILSRPRRLTRTYPYWLYAILSLVVAVILSAKAGADRNYFIEPIMAIAVLAGIGMNRLHAVTKRFHSVRIVTNVGIVIISISPFLRFNDMWFNQHTYLTPLDPKEMFAELDSIDGDILFEDSGLALRSGRPILLLDTFNASYLADARLIDFTPLVRRLEQHEIGAVILKGDLQRTVCGVSWWPKDLAKAITNHYRYSRTIHEVIRVYVPSGRRHTPK